MDALIEASNPESTLLRNETPDEYRDRIRKADEDIREGKGVVFTMEELREYIHKLPE